MITRELHDNCIALAASLKAADPALTAKALVRGAWIATGTPEHALLNDLLALDAVAVCFPTGSKTKVKDLRRVEAILARFAA